MFTEVDDKFFQVVIAAAAGTTLTVLTALGVRFGKRDMVAADAKDVVIKDLQDKVFSMELQRRFRDDTAAAIGAIKTSIDGQFEEVFERLRVIEHTLTRKGIELE